MKLTKTVSLIGLMGAGKSSVGKLIAKHLAVPFRDADQEIETRAGKTIAEIFKEDGEAVFRKMEQSLIAELINASAQPFVLATGGGAFIDPTTRALLKQHTTVIWLKASLQTLLSRVEHSNDRPLLENSNRRQTLTQLIEQRYPIYSEANIIIETDNIDVESTVNCAIDSLCDLGEAC